MCFDVLMYCLNKLPASVIKISKSNKAILLHIKIPLVFTSVIDPYLANITYFDFCHVYLEKSYCILYTQRLLHKVFVAIQRTMGLTVSY
jgi:hypothetical protein